MCFEDIYRTNMYMAISNVYIDLTIKGRNLFHII